MTKAQLEGVWLNGHIHELLRERDLGIDKETEPGNGRSTAADQGPTTSTKAAAPEDATAQALRDALKHAEKVVEAAQSALQSYLGGSAALAARSRKGNRTDRGNVAAGEANNPGGVDTLAAGLTRRGITSRELSGEMGGDTVLA